MLLKRTWQAPLALLWLIIIAGCSDDGDSRSEDAAVPLKNSDSQTEPAVPSWQRKLEGYFDIVETFDELQDWGVEGRVLGGVGTYGGMGPYDSNLLPKKIDGSPSRWHYWNSGGATFEISDLTGAFIPGEIVTNGTVSTSFSKLWHLDGRTYMQCFQISNGSKLNFKPGDTILGLTSGAAARMHAWPKYIANFGEYSWRGGKSLAMNLGDNDNRGPVMVGMGAQRMGTFVGKEGDPSSGYKKLYLFMMIKFRPTFFPQNPDGSFQYWSTFKFFDVCSGFSSIGLWGTETQRNSTAGTPQINNEYGLNSTVFTVSGGGVSTPRQIYFNEIANVANWTGTKWDAVRAQFVDPAMGVRKLINPSSTDMHINGYVTAGNWFGLELAYDIGTPGHPDSTIDLWIYDGNGAERGHFVRANEQKLVNFDHLYNKITLGGNIRSNGHSDWSNSDQRFYVDDFIIHRARIGPTYFSFVR